MKGAGVLSREKSSLAADLELAAQELERAAAISPAPTLEMEGQSVSADQLKALIFNLHGQIDMIWGTTDRARQHFSRSLEIMADAAPHYMLGFVYESEYKPADALKHFEKCLDLDPDGEFSVSALREANAMRNYKKRFRGDWGTFFGLLLVFPFGVWYFIRNWK